MFVTEISFLSFFDCIRGVNIYGQMFFSCSVSLKSEMLAGVQEYNSAY